MWSSSQVGRVVYIRAPSRIAWDLPIRYRQGSKRVSLLLQNLTPRGARVEGLESLQVGDMAMVQLPGLAPKAARVVWTRGEAAGIEFERPLHPSIFDNLVNEHAEPRIRTIADLEPERDERAVFDIA